MKGEKVDEKDVRRCNDKISYCFYLFVFDVVR